MKARVIYPLITILGALLWTNLPGASAADFYDSKTLRFVVGSAPGGGYDTYTRMIARHINRHIPGNPATVVENMDGAGGLIAANYLS
jgi:tripartite-type tricarboxylate transporter receptor subunit TctC